MTFCMGEGKQKGFLTVTLIALTDCHISSFTQILLSKKMHMREKKKRISLTFHFVVFLFSFLIL